MTIRDLIAGGINLQGNIDIRVYDNDDLFCDGVYLHRMGGIYPDSEDVSRFADLEIKHIFSGYDNLVIEMEKED